MALHKAFSYNTPSLFTVTQMSSGECHILDLLFSPPVFQAENILLLELDLPTRTTKDYEGPVIAPKVAAALEDALREEDEIQVDASGLRASFGSSPGLSASAAGFSKKPKSG